MAIPKVQIKTFCCTCPKCGDPRPLDRANMSPSAGKRALIVGLVVASIAAAAAYFFYSR